MNSLAAFPQYRAVANRTVELDELRGLLQPGEAYLKLVQLGDSIYALYASGKDAVMGGMLVLAIGYLVWGLIAPRFAPAVAKA